MIKIERLKRFIEFQERIEKDRVDPDLTDEDWDEYSDLVRQIAFDFAQEMWQDEEASGVLMALFNPPHPYGGE